MFRLFRPIAFVVVALGCCSLANADVLTHYTFDNALTDTATAGATADDLTALDNTSGTVSSVFAPGVLGNAASLAWGTGLPNLLSAADSNDLDLATEAWTMEMYVQPDAVAVTDWNRICLKWVGGEGANQYHWNMQGSSDKQELLTNGGSTLWAQGSTALVKGAWSHIAITNDATNGLQMWQNGSVVLTAAYQTISAGTHPLQFGNQTGAFTPDCQFTGLIDDFMIHDVALDATYMQTRTAAIPEPSTVVLLAVALGMFLCRMRSIVRR